MEPMIFKIIDMLEKGGVHFYLSRNQPDSICLTATFVGERLEIEVFRDNHVEISRFSGDESVDNSGLDLLIDRIERHK